MAEIVLTDEETSELRGRARRSRFHTHYTPTYAFWINLVESWFAVLTNRRLRRGRFSSTRQLEAAVAACLDARNATSAFLLWAKPAADVFDSVRRFCLPTSDSDH